MYSPSYLVIIDTYKNLRGLWKKLICACENNSIALLLKLEQKVSKSKFAVLIIIELACTYSRFAQKYARSKFAHSDNLQNVAKRFEHF